MEQNMVTFCQLDALGQPALVKNQKANLVIANSKYEFIWRIDNYHPGKK